MGISFKNPRVYEIELKKTVEKGKGYAKMAEIETTYINLPYSSPLSENKF